MIGAALGALSICIFICGVWDSSPYSVRPCELTTKTRMGDSHLIFAGFPQFVSGAFQIESENSYKNGSRSGYQPAIIVSDFDSLSEKEKRDAIGGAIFYLILTGITAYLVTYRDTIKK